MSTLLSEAGELRDQYDEEPSHSDHVTALALQLFDGWSAWHGLAARPRELLGAAALLHDIGWSQTPDGRGHHKESARLIRKHDWKTLTPEEVALVAQVARYHRKAVPRPEHEGFQALPSPARRQVMILGGILRVADALDRTHTERIRKLSASVTDTALWIRVCSAGPWEAELTMFEAKRDMLETASGKSVRCEAAEQ